LHKLVAQTINEKFPAVKEANPEVLARHWTEAGEIGQAVAEWSTASTAAEARSAFKESAESYQQALALLEQLPESAERDRSELALQVRYGVAILATSGWNAPEFGKAYTRAEVLCASVGKDTQLFTVLFGLWSFHLVRGEYLKSRAYADEMLNLASRLNDDASRVQAHWASGATCFFMGQLSNAHESFCKSVACYDISKHRQLASRFGQDPGMSSLCYDAITLWLRGFSDQARRRAQEALRLARDLGYPFSLVWCLSNLGKYHVLRKDYAIAEAVINEGLELCSDYQLRFYEAMNRTYGGIAFALQGKYKEFKENARLAPTAPQGDSVLGLTSIYSCLAESFVKRGKLDNARRLLDGASALVSRAQERYFEAEVERIRGEMALKQYELEGQAEGLCSEAEKSFRQAMVIAESAGAKMLQLRATVSLGRLLLRTARGREAEHLVTGCYAWFSEGFDAPDLVEARAFLDEVRGHFPVSGPTTL
jgi:predicted ATPase